MSSALPQWQARAFCISAPAYQALENICTRISISVIFLDLQPNSIRKGKVMIS